MTALAVPEGLEPLGVWDSRGSLWWWAGDIEGYREAIAWACRHIPDVGRTYRVEFYVLDTPFAVVHRYKLNADGFKYQESSDDDGPAKEGPVMEMLAALPPAHLLLGAA